MAQFAAGLAKEDKSSIIIAYHQVWMTYKSKCKWIISYFCKDLLSDLYRFSTYVILMYGRISYKQHNYLSHLYKDASIMPSELRAGFGKSVLLCTDQSFIM